MHSGNPHGKFKFGTFLWYSVCDVYARIDKEE